MRKDAKNRKQTGFTLLEAMISVLVLSFGVLSLAVVYAQGIFYANMSQMDYVAEKKAESAMETIFTARDTKVLTWSQICNKTGVSGASGGVFGDGPQPMIDPGPDGLIDTDDDNAAIPDVVVTGPGADKQLGTSDDDKFSLNPWMTRTIAITPVANELSLRQVTITIDYTVGKHKRTYTLISYISAYA